MKTKPIVTTEQAFTARSFPDVDAITKPKAIESNMLTEKHKANIALFLEEIPIEMEYIEAVIANVASVGEKLVFQTSSKRGRRGTIICRNKQVINSPNSSETPFIGLAIQPHSFTSPISEKLTTKER